jgi:hypothetical protein
MTISSAADAANAISLDIDGQTTGRDIEGTGASFYVEGDGSVVGVDADFTGAAGITLQNDATITNAVDGAFLLTEGGEDLSLTFNANTVSLGTSTTMDSFAFGVVDDLEGVGSITFDAVSSAITLPTDGAAQDLLLQTTGATNSSIVIQSTGTAADALVLNTTAGGIDITNGGAAGGEDIDIDAVLASLNLNADEDVADAMTITTTAGGIDVTADGGAASDLDLVCTNGSTNISGGEAIADAVTIAAGAGGVDITSAATFDIDVTATGGKFLVSATENAANTIELQENGGASGGINIYANQGTGVAASTEDDASIQLHSDDGGIGLYTTANLANAIRIETNGGGNETIVLQSVQGTSTNALTLTATAGGINVDAADDIDILLTATGANEDIIIATGGTQDSHITVNADGSSANALTLNASVGGLDMDSATTMDIDSAGAFTLNQAGDTLLIQLDADGANDDLTIQTSGAQDTSLVLASSGTAANAIDIDVTAGGIDIDMSGGAAGEDFQITTATSIDLVSTEANAGQFKMDAQGTIAGFAIILETTDGGIQLNADNSGNGDITIDAADVLSLTTGDSIIVDGGPIVPDIEYLTVDGDNLLTYGTTDFDSSGVGLTYTLGSPTLGTAAVGTIKCITMSTAGNNADVTITNHETSDPEVARFDAADEYLLLVWTGTEWATISNSCTFP